MPGVLGQVGQNVADSLFEVGKSVVNGTVGAVTDIAHETIEQVTPTPSQVIPADKAQNPMTENKVSQEKVSTEKRRFDEVKAELARYIQRRNDLDKKIAEEQALQTQQKKKEQVINEKKRDSWINRMINRSQTSTERGRLSE